MHPVSSVNIYQNRGMTDPCFCSILKTINSIDIKRGTFMTSKQRITYLDMAKGAGVVLMVTGHLIGSLQTIDNKPYFSPLYQWIASFHMPLFFVISGIVLWITREEERDMRQIVYRKAKGLLLPYASFSLIYFVMNIWTCIFQPDLLQFSELWRYLIYSVTFRGVSVLWFLPALFLGEVVFLWVRKRMETERMTVLFSVTGFLLFFFSPVLGWEGWELNPGLMTVGAVLLTLARGLLSCTFLLAGYLAAGLVTAGEKKSAAGFLLGAAMLAADVLLCPLNGSVDLNYMVFGNFLLYLLCACLGSFGVILICKNMYRSKLLLFYGANSLVIMATHMEFKVMLHTIRFSYWLNQYVTRAKEWVLYATMAVCITILEAGLICLFRHVLYFLIGKEKPEKACKVQGSRSD